MKILAIAQRELKVLFLSPLAWVIFGIVQFIAAFLFLDRVAYFLKVQPQIMMNPNIEFGVTEIILPNVYIILAFLMLFVIPLLTMRLIADERKNRTLSLLMSAPISMTEIIFGKYIGLYAFLLIIILTTTLMPLSLAFSGPIDYGLLASIVLGIMLLTGTISSIGLYMSSLTRQPIVAVISTYGILLFLWFVGDVGDSSENAAGNSLAYLSITRHFESFLKGLFSSADFFFYLILIFAFIILSIKRLDADRLQH